MSENEDQPRQKIAQPREWAAELGSFGGRALSFLHSALEQSSEGIALSAFDGTLQFVNRAFAHMHGYSVEELEGRHVSSFISPDQLPQFGEAARQIREHGEYRGEHWQTRRDGTAVYVQMQNSLVRDAAGNPVAMLGTFRDLTERKRAENLLRIQRDLSVSAGNAESLEELLALCLAAAIEASELDCGAIYLVDASCGALNLVVQQGLSPAFVEASSRYGADAPNTSLVMAGEPVYFNYAKSSLATAVDKRAGDRKALAVVPVWHRRAKVVVGCLNVGSHVHEQVPEHSRGILETIASQIGDAIANRQAREALAQSEARFRTLVETTSDWIWEVDWKGRYAYASPRVKDLLGYEPAEVIGKSPLDFVPEHEAKRAFELLARIQAARKPFDRFEAVCRHKNGSQVVLEISGVPFFDSQGRLSGYRGIARDITDRKQAEQENRMLARQVRQAQEAESTELRRLRNYLSNIIDSMPSVLIGVDSEGKVTQWNAEAQRVTGIGQGAAVQQPLGEVFPRLAAEMDRVHEAIRSRKTLFSPKQDYQKDGVTRYESITIYPLVTNGVEGAVIRVDDVTERVQIEEMMVQSEKMLSVGGLAAGMAHEINNPLAGMMLTASVMSERLTDLEMPANRRAAEAAGISMEAISTFMEARGITRMLERIHSSGSRIAEIVSNMLSFARKSDSTFSTRDLAALLDQSVDLAGSDYDLKKKYDFRQIEIIREYEPNLPALPCEGAKIQQVFFNVLRNGAEAMQSATDKPRFILRLAHDKEAARVRIEIEDNGPGMAEETRKRVFEPFFTTKPTDQGTGLGLSVSYFIITENHAGEMSVESTPGQGAKFIISLPLQPPSRRPRTVIPKE